MHDDSRPRRGRPVDDDACQLRDRGCGRGRPGDDRPARDAHVLRRMLDGDHDGSSLHGNRGMGGRQPQRGALTFGPEQMPRQEQ